MTRKLGIAGLQLMKNFENHESNLKKFESIARTIKAKYPWVDLIFTGELYLQKYGADNWKKYAESIPNALTNKLSKLAQELDCWLVPGSFLEKEDENIYNTALALNPNGEIVALYRKIFPWMPHEDTNWGVDFVVFDISDIAKVGIVICYDIWFPELFRTLAWMGAEVILQPSLTCASDRPPELILAQAQAIINQCYIINVNGICPRGGGESIFVDPEGRILQKSGTHEAVMTEVIDIDKVSWVRQNGFLGLNPVWKSLRDSPLKGKFPIYERFHDGEIFKNLGDLKLQSNIRKWDN